MEDAVLEPRAERIARYKAERRRELAERFNSLDDLPSKWGRRNGQETPEPVTQTCAQMINADGLGERVNYRAQEVTNGVENDAPAESNSLIGQGNQDPATLLSAPQLHTRVSVGQLRSALLQQTDSGAQPERASIVGGRAMSSLDLALTSGAERGRRRTQRYLPGGTSGSRKTNERFRTQPITANEVEESSGLLDVETKQKKKADEQTDDRAKMSVAAKMSLFKEMERSAAPETSDLLKPRSTSSSHEHRMRRSSDHRFLTQPITCEEMVAASTPPPAEAQIDPFDDEDESCKMSMSEKLALFNKLALPRKLGAGSVDGPPERRRQKGARYRTQPITVEEVSMLQKGPVQLPAFSLSAHLSDRQQVSSVNLKPSEVRLSQPRPGLTESAPEPVLKGILKKSHSAGSERSRMDQNGGDGGDADILERMKGTSAPTHRRKRESSDTPPWRQRVPTRRQTIACTPMKAFSEQGAPQEGSTCESTEEESSSPVEHSLDRTEGARKLEEETRSKVDGEKNRKGSVQVILADNPPNEATSTSQSQEAPGVERWEPVFASVYSVVSPQYIMCFNQTNLSYEAQEVSPPLPAQPQWRQKTKELDLKLHAVEAEETETQKEAEDGLGVAAPETRDEAFSSETGTCTDEASQSDSVTETQRNEEMSAGEPSALDGPIRVGPSLPPTCGPTPCGGIATTEPEQDLGVFCQSSTPILSSAVAEHRRAVRPSRRTQGSRNPLRALAARQDIMQDFMGDRVNAAEEQDQAEKKCKNHSSEDPVIPEDIVSPSEAPKSFPPFNSRMLIHIKGRRHVQVRLVEPSVRSLNSGDCFLLVTPQHCILWSGEFANKQERAKASELASFIHSHRDLGCETSHVVHLEEGLNSDSSEAEDFWSLLGGRTNYRGAGVSEEDELFELGVVESNCVYRLVEDRLVPHEQAWASIPNVSLLCSTEALVFDFGSEVYLWHGWEVSPARRDVALQLTQQVWAGEYDYSNCRVNPLDPTRSNPSIHPKGASRPSWALLAVVSEGEETALFKEKFADWAFSRGGAQEDASASAETQKSTHRKSPQPAPSDVLCPCDAKALVSGESLGGSVCTVLEGVDVQRGCGVITLEEGHQMELKTVAVDTWHVQEFDDSEIPVESSGQLHEGDSYVVRWTYSVGAVGNGSDKSERASGSKEKTAFFLWRGRHSSVSGRDTAAFLSIGLKNHEESQVVVPQGEEPPCFLQLFQGGLVIHKGKREETFPSAEWRLFCVRGELPQEGSLLEVDCCCASLRSRGAVVLLNSQKGELYLWIGCKAHSNTREVSKCPPELGLHKSSPINVHFVEEGSEPAGFWAALGPMDRKAYDCMLQDPGKYNFTPRLFHLTTSSGKFQAKELLSRSRLPGLVMAMPFIQESLYSVSQPALFLLDNRLEVYLWQRGQPAQTESSASAWSLWHDERKCAMQTALQYCKEMNPRRPPHAYLILEGLEPLTFTNVFPRWERFPGPQTQGDVGQVKLTLVQDALAQLMKTQYPMEELIRSPLPEGVDPQQLEVYLSDQDFQTILEKKREEHASLPSWKQSDEEE